MHELDSEKRSQLASRIISIHSSISQERIVLFFNWQQLSGMDMRRKIMNVSSAKWTVQVPSSFSLLPWCFFFPLQSGRGWILLNFPICVHSVPYQKKKAIKRCLSNLFYLEMNLFFTTFARSNNSINSSGTVLFNDQSSYSKTLSFSPGKGKWNWDSDKSSGTIG